MTSGKMKLVKELEDIIMTLITGIEYLNANRRLVDKYFNKRNDSSYYINRQIYNYMNKFNLLNGKRKWGRFLILEELIIGLPYLIISTAVKLKLIESTKEVFKEHEWKVIHNIITSMYNFLEENIYSSENDNLLLLLDQIIKNNTPIRDPNVEPMELYITTGKKYINTNYNHFLDLSSISFQLEGIGNELEEIFPEYDTNIHRKILEIICNDNYRNKCFSVYFEHIFNDIENEGVKKWGLYF